MGTLLEKLGFRQLVEETLKVKRQTRVMPAYQFILAMVLACYVGFSRLHHMRFLQREPMLTGILGVLRLPPQCTFWRFLASLHGSVAHPSGRRTTCAPSCRCPEPRHSISRWLLPILAVAYAAAPPTAGRPRCRAERPGTARRYIAAAVATLPRFPSAWARAVETACDAAVRNPRSRPAPSPE